MATNISTQSQQSDRQHPTVPLMVVQQHSASKQAEPLGLLCLLHMLCAAVLVELARGAFGVQIGARIAQLHAQRVGQPGVGSTTRCTLLFALQPRVSLSTTTSHVRIQSRASMRAATQTDFSQMCSSRLNPHMLLLGKQSSRLAIASAYLGWSCSSDRAPTPLAQSNTKQGGAACDLDSLLLRVEKDTVTFWYGMSWNLEVKHLKFSLSRTSIDDVQRRFKRPHCARQERFFQLGWLQTPNQHNYCQSPGLASRAHSVSP